MDFPHFRAAVERLPAVIFRCFSPGCGRMRFPRFRRWLCAHRSQVVKSGKWVAGGTRSPTFPEHSARQWPTMPQCQFPCFFFAPTFPRELMQINQIWNKNFVEKIPAYISTTLFRSSNRYTRLTALNKNWGTTWSMLSPMAGGYDSSLLLNMAVRGSDVTMAPTRLVRSIDSCPGQLPNRVFKSQWTHMINVLVSN